jgi:hypothetical protein
VEERDMYWSILNSVQQTSALKVRVRSAEPSDCGGEGYVLVYPEQCVTDKCSQGKSKVSCTLRLWRRGICTGLSGTMCNPFTKVITIRQLIMEI